MEPLRTLGASFSSLSVERWHQAQQAERCWWGDCVNTYQEETKHLTVAERMGLQAVSDNGHWPVYDLAGMDVVDLGGGPVSLLLKCINGGRLTVVDPLRYPRWVRARYREAGIKVEERPAETFLDKQRYDEAWIYNTLQHVQDPRQVVGVAKKVAARVRIFEWIDVDNDEAHPHTLDAHALNAWLGGRGTCEPLSRFGGIAYYGLFAS